MARSWPRRSFPPRWRTKTPSKVARFPAQAGTALAPDPLFRYSDRSARSPGPSRSPSMASKLPTRAPAYSPPRAFFQGRAANVVVPTGHGDGVGNVAMAMPRLLRQDVRFLEPGRGAGAVRLRGAGRCWRAAASSPRKRECGAGWVEGIGSDAGFVACGEAPEQCFSVARVGTGTLRPLSDAEEGDPGAVMGSGAP